ncbi:chloroplast carotene biosynthesis related protein [Dunaliella salina]|uniref:Chloroplast carotene biosynthesis related protein n=1 Tax=Dunaliella salina TaxID=3046 RepID=A0ABQ7GDQ2_DUNSA|nr:chloroplast carotene biosynthesis related protein [Dunaliella salina]|eukprot:KAF5832724.1 chloroplast carotene biosynthesis related protein [Dunaliella salina]
MTMLQFCSTSRVAVGASVRPSPVLRGASAPRRAVRQVVRAEPPEQEAQQPQSATPQTPSNPPPATSASAVSVPPSVEEVMGFSGAPEIINGRLAMLGFVAALGAELSTGDSVLRQLAEEPTLISLTFILFSAASLVPAFARRNGDTLGPFTPQAEMLNGRAAMIGFAAMLILESVQGAALF